MDQQTNCSWTVDKWGWKTSCGHIVGMQDVNYWFVQNNKMRYCPMCGKKVERTEKENKPKRTPTIGESPELSKQFDKDWEDKAYH